MCVCVCVCVVRVCVLPQFTQRRSRADNNDKRFPVSADGEVVPSMVLPNELPAGCHGEASSEKRVNLLLPGSYSDSHAIQ